MRPTTYKTRQDRLLRECLASMAGRHTTAAELCAALGERGEKVGRATVYRRLERLVEEGTARKYVSGPGVPACYAWAGKAPSGAGVFHGYCEGCGAVLHLHCGQLAGVARHLARSHRFRLDPSRTVFYGTCAKCARRRGGVR